MYTQKTITQTLQDFESDLVTGLKQDDVKHRQNTYGPNELAKEKNKSLLSRLMQQLNDPLILILVTAAAISILLHEYGDACIIAVVISLNAVIGLIQEGKAMRALDALKELTNPSALVRRGGTLYELPARDLVPGDIVILEAGRQVPADLRLLCTQDLRIEESALTGESIPVEKDASFISDKRVTAGDSLNMAFMSTNVLFGRGEGVAVATGMNTQIGRIAHTISQTVQEATPLQKRLADLGKLLSIIAIVLCVILFGIAMLQQRNLPEMLITAISLAVASYYRAGLKRIQDGSGPCYRKTPAFG